MNRVRPKALAVAALAAALSVAQAAGETPTDWPDTVVRIEELRPLTSFSLKIPGAVTRGEVRGPSVIQAHVSTGGVVVKASLLESCGNADLDEAAIHAMRAMKFSPYTFGGVPTEVSLVVPIHVPKQFGRSR